MKNSYDTYYISSVDEKHDTTMVSCCVHTNSIWIPLTFVQLQLRKL